MDSPPTHVDHDSRKSWFPRTTCRSTSCTASETSTAGPNYRAGSSSKIIKQTTWPGQPPARLRGKTADQTTRAVRITEPPSRKRSQDRTRNPHMRPGLRSALRPFERAAAPTPRAHPRAMLRPARPPQPQAAPLPRRAPAASSAAPRRTSPATWHWKAPSSPAAPPA